MRNNLAIYGKGSVLDVGSLQAKSRHKTFREILSPACTSYTGTDIVEGKNVDVVCTDVFPFKDETFDTVITGSCFEHCSNPFTLIKECARVLKPGGFFMGTAPFVFGVHKYPVDCWRILPDGWVSLFTSAGLKPVAAYLMGEDMKQTDGKRLKDVEIIDCWGIAKK